MNHPPSTIVVFLLGSCLTLLLARAPAQAGVCAGNLTNRADVVGATPGNNYDVYYDVNPMSADFFPALNAGWVRDALFGSHHAFVSTNGFRNPNFSASPNDTCISAGAPCWADAPLDRIRLSTCMNGLNEPFTRSVVNH